MSNKRKAKGTLLHPRKHTHTASDDSASRFAPAAARDRLIRLFRHGDYALAAAEAEKTASLYPDDAYAWTVLGSSRLRLKDYVAAQDALDKANALFPDDHQILDALARTHAWLGNHTQAVALQRQSLSIEPSHAPSHFHLAALLNEEGNKDAFEHLDRAEALGYNLPEVLSLRGTMQIGLLRFREALDTFRKLLERCPDLPETQNSIANLYKDMTEFSKADAAYAKALELSPGYVQAYSNRLFSMHYNPAKTGPQIRDFACQWDVRFRPSRRLDPHRGRVLEPARRLRIGLLSSGFRLHPVGQMITPALEHVGDALEIHAYSIDNIHDPITARLKKAATSWQSVGHLDESRLADLILADQIDILIDLSGHGAGNRLRTISMKPAPLIVKWVGGLVNTMGLAAFDYLLSDHVETPPGCDGDYVEKLIRMPDDYICYLPPDYLPPITALPAIGNGHITFGCFNNPAKINDVLLGEWAKLLHMIPNSRLLLKGAQYDSPEFCERIRHTLASHGIDATRVTLEGPTSHRGLLESYNRVDIALDPWPYSGGLTTCEAMLMGVPVITHPGPTFAGRHSSTHIINAGMPELVTESWDEYRQRAIELAQDWGNLSVIRACLRQVLLKSPVCDGARFAWHFTTAMRAIWQRYCEGKAPAALSLDKTGQARFEDEAQPVQLARIKPEGFDFPFEGHIITVDHGGILVNDPIFPRLQEQGRLAAIVFDPASRVSNIEMLQLRGEVHHYPGVALGDGNEGVVYVCADPDMSSTLRPLSPGDQLSGNVETTRIVDTQPLPTLALDSIEGLGSIDWLLLDNMNDSLMILENGEKTLAETLLVQVRVNFSPTHKKQPELTQISHWLARHGFSFYRLNNLQHYSHLPKRDDLLKQQATQLVSADAIFIPSAHRLEHLGAQKTNKLAFILHTVYQMQDLAFSLLTQNDTDEGEKYLEENSYLRKLNQPFQSKQPHRIYINHGHPKACIGIPVYNEERYIRETILSLKKQDVDGVRFVIYDNASSDRTYEIAQELSSDDARFELTKHPQNLGSADNFFKLFKESASDYFMWLGGHDCLSEHYLQDVIEILDQNNNISMACGLPFGIMDEKIFGPVKEALYDFSQESPLERYIKSVAELTNCTIFHSMFRKDALKGFEFRKTISADHVVISRLLWSGRLEYATNSQYLRRYFKSRDTTTEERLTGGKGKLERKEFFDYYKYDISHSLNKESCPKKQTMDIIGKIERILKARFTENYS